MNVIAKTASGVLAIVLSGLFSAVAGTTTFSPLPETHASVSQQRPSERIVAAKNAAAAYNWAGYVADEGQYSAVSGTWIVPNSVDYTGRSADATWVGIGGVDTDDLIQAGTEALPDGSGGTEYSAWYEVLPDDSQIIRFPVRPGDSVSVSIAQAASGIWDISFRNNTNGATYEKRVRYASSLSSAEWIEEMPVSPDVPISLDDFGSVQFTEGSAVKNGERVSIAQSGATPLRMDNGSREPLAIPSELGENGMSFSVVRTEAAASPLQFGSERRHFGF